MTRSEYFEGALIAKGERPVWSPTLKLILAFIIGFLLLTPAILGLYWELFLPEY